MGVVSEHCIRCVKDMGEEHILTDDVLQLLENQDTIFNQLLMECVLNDVVDPLNFLHPYRRKYGVEFRKEKIIFYEHNWYDPNDNTTAELFTIKTDIEDNGSVTIAWEKQWMLNKYWQNNLDGIIEMEIGVGK